MENSQLQLPSELLELILSNIYEDDILHLMQTCHLFYNSIFDMSDYFFTSLVFGKNRVKNIECSFVFSSSLTPKFISQSDEFIKRRNEICQREKERLSEAIFSRVNRFLTPSTNLALNLVTQIVNNNDLEKMKLLLSFVTFDSITLFDLGKICDDHGALDNFDYCFLFFNEGKFGDEVKENETIYDNTFHLDENSDKINHTFYLKSGEEKSLTFNNDDTSIRDWIIPLCYFLGTEEMTQTVLQYYKPQSSNLLNAYTFGDGFITGHVCNLDCSRYCKDTTNVIQLTISIELGSLNEFMNMMSDYNGWNIQSDFFISSLELKK